MMETRSERQMAIYQAWENIRLEHPTPDQWYLIQIVTAIHQILAKNPRSIELKDFVLKFKHTVEQQKPKTKEEATKWAMAKWGSLMTMPVKVKKG